MKFEIETFDDNGNRDKDGLNFRGVIDTEVGTQVIDKGWCKFACAWSEVGNTTFQFVAWGGKYNNNKVIEGTALRRDGIDDDYWGIPAGTRMITVAGKKDRKETLISASVLPKGA